MKSAIQNIKDSGVLKIIGIGLALYLILLAVSSFFEFPYFEALYEVITFLLLSLLVSSFLFIAGIIFERKIVV